MTFVGVALRDSLGSGTVGLSLIYCFTLSGLFQWIVRQSAEVENQMISVERITQLNSLEQEHDEGGPAPEGWPSSGSIEFKNVTMRYSEDSPLVLRGLNFFIESGEKIGIVGRTGAGKVCMLRVCVCLCVCMFVVRSIQGYYYCCLFATPLIPRS